MLKLGVIGTSWITRQFIDAALETGDYELAASYSRSKERGREFVADFSKVEVYDNLEGFVSDEGLDVIYIASPNALHYEQAKAAVTAGKNVIVEKPSFSNPKEFTEVFKLAKENHVFVLEAIRNIHEVAFRQVKDFLADKTIVGAKLTYAKYSSKMPALLRGELPNKWNVKFSGGTLTDLGVYLLYFALGLFSEPESVYYDVQMLPSDVDVSGNGLLRYENYDVTLHTAGNLNSFVANEIYTTEGTLVLDSIAALHSVEFVKLDGSKVTFEIHPTENPLFEEANDFAGLLTNPQDEETQKTYEELYKLAKNVNQALYAMRQDAGIVFPADK